MHWTPTGFVRMDLDDDDENKNVAEHYLASFLML